ncbi:hypothetical protein [Xenorhabdus griffiniae]|uniref:hypothetical protein n=1 Tax=Xenorhabdus griffiniae TaxID=351672 RepID=UPI00235821D2|nr:hypothetical protein [Xenorhabdus griffiniae]MDC9607413.1 hypothetical protein [Xenorhabdus griffiniae]
MTNSDLCKEAFELAREMKKRSELALLAYDSFMKSNSDADRFKFQAAIDYLDLMRAPKKLITLCEAVEKLAEYEIIINAYHQDDADWHKLADINGAIICALVDGIVKLQSKVSEYENMAPVAI